MQEIQETQFWSLGQEDLMEKEMATHSSIHCLGNPKDKEVQWVAVHGGHKRVGHNLATKQQEQTDIISTILEDGTIRKGAYIQWELRGEGINKQFLVGELRSTGHAAWPKKKKKSN